MRGIEGESRKNERFLFLPPTLPLKDGGDGKRLGNMKGKKDDKEEEGGGGGSERTSPLPTYVKREVTTAQDRKTIGLG